jgi:hypothetical protein
MKIKFFIAAITFVFSNILFAQELHVGTRVEPFIFLQQKISDEGVYVSKYSFAPIPSFYFLIGKNISDEFEFDLKPGILIMPDNDFNGFELGLTAEEKNFLSKKIYLTGGINLHFVSESAHGTSFVEVTYSKIIYFILLGVGYKLSDQIAIDITYHEALNPKYGYKAYSFDDKSVTGPTKLLNLIKIGFQFTTGN